MSNSKDRRKFLKLLLTGGAVAVSAQATGQSLSPSDDKVKMLTDDGTLVEVDKTVFEQMKKGQKASNSEIRDFIKPPNKNSDGE